MLLGGGCNVVLSVAHATLAYFGTHVVWVLMRDRSLLNPLSELPVIVIDNADAA